MEQIFWHWAVERRRCSSGHFCYLKEVSSGQATTEGRVLLYMYLQNCRTPRSLQSENRSDFFDCEQTKTIEPDR